MDDNSSEKRTLDPIIDDETKRRLWAEAQKATPDHVLETQLHDSRIPKPEIVHYASRKITELREEVERLRKDAARWKYARQRLAPAECVNHGWPSLGDLPPGERIESRLDRMADIGIDAAMESE